MRLDLTPRRGGGGDKGQETSDKGQGTKDKGPQRRQQRAADSARDTRVSVMMRADHAAGLGRTRAQNSIWFAGLGWPLPTAHIRFLSAAEGSGKAKARKEKNRKEKKKEKLSTPRPPHTRTKESDQKPKFRTFSHIPALVLGHRGAVVHVKAVVCWVELPGPEVPAAVHACGGSTAGVRGTSKVPRP